MTIIIYSLPIQPHPVFSAVIRSKDLVDQSTLSKTCMDWSILKLAEETMDHVKNKHGLMNTRACHKTVHLLENTHGFKNTRSIDVEDRSLQNACSSAWVPRASVTDRGSLLRFHMWLVGINLTDSPRHNKSLIDFRLHIDRLTNFFSVLLSTCACAVDTKMVQQTTCERKITMQISNLEHGNLWDKLFPFLYRCGWMRRF